MPKHRHADAEWARALVMHCIERMSAAFEDNIADTTHGENVNSLAAFIRERGRVTATDLTRKFRTLDRRVRAGMIEDLVEAGMVEKDTMQTTGRWGTEYIWRG